MLPPAVIEQQAKLGVSAEESKVERLKRQQARFRDRGGAFVPSNSNPLIDILLARTVSGESPSKPRPKHAVEKRCSPSKARHSTTLDEQVQPIAGSSKPKPSASRKRKAKAVEPKADPVTKTAPKRRGRPPKGKKKAPESDTEEQLPKTTSKTKGKKGNVVPSSTEGKQKAKTKVKSNSAKKVVEILPSDDDQTLVEFPPKAKSDPKRFLAHEGNGETDDDAPLIRNQVHPSKKSGTKATSRVNTGKITNMANLEKKKLEDGEERARDDSYSRSDAKKRPVPRDDDVDNNSDLAPPAKKKKGKVTNTASAKLSNVPEPDVEIGESIKATGTAKRNGRMEPNQGTVKRVENGDERPPERVTKAKKRKEDNCDDRPRKVVKFSESVPSYSSSRQLKENMFDGKHKKDKPSVADSKSVTKPPSSAKFCRGPPREVLERIKASAARHLRCADSEPDELDCLS